MHILRKHKNSIDFVLVFIPSALLLVGVWDGEDLNNIFYYSKNSMIPSGFGSDGMVLLAIYGPFILWKIFTKYLIK